VIEVPIPTRYTKESSSISVSRSLAYIVKTLAYCAARTSVRGRRGRRSPVVWTGGPEGATGSGGLIGPRRVGAARASEQPALTADFARVVASRLVDAIGGYVVRGSRMLVVTARPDDLRGLGEDRQWVTLFAEADASDGVAIFAPTQQMPGDRHERYAAVDAVALVDGFELAPDPVEPLRRIRPMIDPEGILVLAVPLAGAGRILRARGPLLRQPGLPFSAESLRLALHLAGFRMVEWLAPGTLASQGTRLGIAVARPARSAIPGRGYSLDGTGTDVPTEVALPKEP
jgi:hypothetical protein